MDEPNPFESPEADSTTPDAGMPISPRAGIVSWLALWILCLFSSASTICLLITGLCFLMYLVGIAGVRRYVQGDTIIFSVERWSVAVIILVAVAVVVAGWIIRPKMKCVGYLLIGGGILALATTGPGLAMSKTVIDPDHFEWWRGVKHTSMRFDELSEIVHTIKQVRIGKMIHDVHYFEFRKKDGEVLHVEVDPWSDRHFLDASPEIFDRAKSKGVTISEPRRE